MCVSEAVLQQKHVVVRFACWRVSSSCARDCVFLTRDMACTTAQENLMCPSYPAWYRSLCLFEFTHGSKVDLRWKTV